MERWSGLTVVGRSSESHADRDCWSKSKKSSVSSLVKAESLLSLTDVVSERVKQQRRSVRSKTLSDDSDLLRSR